MKTLLLINSSARAARSVTRHLTARFASAWAARHPEAEIISRDVGLNPPSFINEAWISAAFAEATHQTPATRESLATSETLIEELFRASVVVMGAPMFNFGMPAGLKAYVDQIVRAGRTFAMDGDDPAWPYRPLIPAKPLVIITSAGATGYEPGGPAAHLNFLDSHLETVFKFIGFTDISFVRVGSEEHKGEHFTRIMAEAEQEIAQVVARLSNGIAGKRPHDLRHTEKFDCDVLISALCSS
jgi:FMN-dependent NADH-azoreductase